LKFEYHQGPTRIRTLANITKQGMKGRLISYVGYGFGWMRSNISYTIVAKRPVEAA
jgi:hypothetical protein